LTRDRAPTREIKIAVDALQFVRRKDVSGTSNEDGTGIQKSVIPGLHEMSL
jgi:hypothetical protein